MSKRTLIILIAVFSIPAFLFAQTMESGSYKIQSDSINFGGAPGSSGSYKIEDTLGEVGTGDSASASYVMRAGFQQMQGSYIAISDAADFALPNVNGLTGGTSQGSAAWTVTTDSPAGYSLSVTAGTSPALKSLIAWFEDYVPAGANPDYTFAVAPAAAVFGFSPEGADIITRYKNNGSACNAGSGTTNGCWDGLSTTPKIIAQSTTSNQPTGTVTTVKFQAGIGTSKILENGSYTTTLSVTALAL